MGFKSYIGKIGSLDGYRRVGLVTRAHRGRCENAVNGEKTRVERWGSGGRFSQIPRAKSLSKLQDRMKTAQAASAGHIFTYALCLADNLTRGMATVYR